jgi:hypothetical protein
MAPFYVAVRQLDAHLLVLHFDVHYFQIATLLTAQYVARNDVITTTKFKRLKTTRGSSIPRSYISTLSTYRYQHPHTAVHHGEICAC